MGIQIIIDYKKNRSTKPTPPSGNQIGRKVFRVMCPSVRIHRDGIAGH
jgi:hypothetical protein